MRWRWASLGSVVGQGDPDRATQLQAWHWLMVHGWKHQTEISPAPVVLIKGWRA